MFVESLNGVWLNVNQISEIAKHWYCSVRNEPNCYRVTMNNKNQYDISVEEFEKIMKVRTKNEKQ